MAVELASKVVKDTETYNDYAVGLALPLQFGNETFVQTYKTIDQVKTNIKSLLLTNYGERLVQPEFGSGLTALLFDFNNDDLEEKIEKTVTDSISKWLPYVTVESIEIEATDELKDKNQVNVSITFRVGNDIKLNQLTFTVQG